ncbi:MAG: nitronate monooxygenase, partial [Alphaproteobacteria bacterium]
PMYVTPEDMEQANRWVAQGFSEPLKTPDDTLMFVTPQQANQILVDQIECMGCLSHCRFSNWKDHEEYTTGKKADPRSFCIQKTLQDIVRDGDVEHNLMFSGHNAYKFKQDPFYSNGFVPTIRELVERIMTGY